MFKDNNSWFKNIILFPWHDKFKYKNDLEASRKLMLLNYIVLACIIFLLPFGILSLFSNKIIVGILDLSAAAVIFSAIVYYKKTQNYNLLTYVIIAILGLLFLFLLYSSGIDFSGPLWSFLFPVSVMFMIGKREGVVLSIIYLIVSVLLLFFSPSKEVYTLNFKLRFIGAFIAATIISYYIEYIREAMHLQLQERNLALQNSVKELKKKEEAIAEKEKHFRTLFEASNDSIFLMDGEKFIECNPKTLEMFGCSKDEIINQSPARFSPEYQHDGRLSKNKAIEKIESASKGEPQFFEWTHCKKDGTLFYAEINLTQINVDQKNLILASVRDVTSRKMVEQELVFAKDQAERSDKLKSDFLAQMSHEIRTPINTILNYTSLLKMEFGNDAVGDNKDSFKSIENAAIRLLRTIDLILNISDVEAGTYVPKFQSVNIKEQIILPAVNEFKQAAENKNLRLDYLNGLGNKAIARLDSYTLYQAVANLIDNAIKYTNEGKISVVLKEDEKYIIVKIIDTGIGISKEYIPNLFEKFSQEEAGYTRRYEGSGLGMALVKKYCEINSIDIKVKSRKGEGSTFILKIPKEI